jgi:hypothetical protein
MDTESLRARVSISLRTDPADPLSKLVTPLRAASRSLDKTMAFTGPIPDGGMDN